MLVGDLESVGDSGGVDALANEVLAGTEEGASHDDNGGGSVTGLDILGLGDLDELKHHVRQKLGILTILAVGWITSICLRMVAPSLVMRTLPWGF